MKRYRTIAFLVLGGFFLFTSCKEYLDVNEDPNKPSSVSAPNRLVGAITTANGAALWRASREIAAVCQYGTNKNEAAAAETWRFTSAYFLMQNAYVWSMPNSVDVINLGRENDNPQFIGAGETLLAACFGILTDQLGDIIVHDFYNGTSQLKLEPKMESQKVVYEYIDSLLDDAIQQLKSPKNQDKLGLNATEGDIIYQGDLEKWIKFAYALKARYLNHLSKKSNLYDPQAVIDACSHAFDGDGMDAGFLHLASGPQTNENPWYSWGGFDLGDVTDRNSSDYDPRYFAWSQFFVNMLTSLPVTNDAYTDPRISKIMDPAENDGEYRGLRPGGGLEGGQGILADGQPGDDSKTDGYDYGPFSNSGYYTDETAPTPFITYSEVKFIEAEARLRSNDPQGALSAFKEGVKANMRKLGVASSDISNYLSALGDNGVESDFNDLTKGLSYIMREKYITLCLNPETWVDMRRMDFNQDIYGPSLQRPVNINTVVFDPNDPNQWIRAMCYENNEEIRNPEAVGDNSPKHRLPMHLWWDKED